MGTKFSVILTATITVAATQIGAGFLKPDMSPKERLDWISGKMKSGDITLQRTTPSLFFTADSSYSMVNTK